MSAQAAGLDLVACLGAGGTCTLAPGEHRMVPTGLAMALPPGYEGQVRPRSGLAAKHGITVLNSPGTIDADYRGELRVVLINHGRQPFVVRHGDRIAQLVVAAVAMAEPQWADQLPEAPGHDRDDGARGEGGFGSTGGFGSA